MDAIFDFITEYGLETVLLAVLNCILTGLVKLPLKRLAQRGKDPAALTRYITFLPLILGFGLCQLYTWLFCGGPAFDSAFLTLWLTSVSVSLAVYAYWEKFFPSKKKILQEHEIRQNLELIEKIKAAGGESQAEVSEAGQDSRVIVLKGREHAEAGKES